MTKRFRIACLLIAGALLVPMSATAQQAENAEMSATDTRVVVESYYRIRWGSEGEFMALYQKNHLPILEEAKARGIITDLRFDFPFTHMVGEARWDLRVTTTYRDASAALVKDPALITVFDDVQARLKKANGKFDEEEARRFSLLEEHWDVILVPN